MVEHLQMTSRATDLFSLTWLSDDRQSSVAGETYSSRSEAEAAIGGFSADLAAQGLVGGQVEIDVTFSADNQALLDEIDQAATKAADCRLKPDLVGQVRLAALTTEIAAAEAALAKLRHQHTELAAQLQARRAAEARQEQRVAAALANIDAARSDLLAFLQGAEQSTLMRSKTGRIVYSRDPGHSPASVARRAALSVAGHEEGRHPEG